MKLYVINLTVLFMVCLAAQAAPDTEPRKCPDGSRLRGICNNVDFMDQDSDPDSNYLYLAQKKIYEASCADLEKDSEKEIARKVNLMWEQNEKLLKCNTVNFDVMDGHILKYAVAKRFTTFIEEAAQTWKINLNKVDASDNRTVLDYVSKEIERNKGNANESILRQYYEALRKAGAKHKSELDSSTFREDNHE